MGWKLDGLVQGIDHPTEDDLLGSPTTIALQELLEGDSFQAVVLGHLRVSEDLVDSMEEVLPQSFHVPRASLAELDEVVHKHVGVGAEEGSWTAVRSLH